MESNDNISYHSPVLAVKYRNFWYNFYTKTDYDDWVKRLNDKENISDCKYYKGLGIKNIDQS